MWHKSKMCIAIIFGLFVLGQMSVFAQTTVEEEAAYCKSISICGSAPREFSLMVEFTQELINSIQTLGTEGKYLGKYVNPNRFKGATFSPPVQTISGKIENYADKKLDFAIATTTIFVSPQKWGGLTDIFSDIFVLFKNKVFQRDLQRVNVLDTAITQKRYQIGLGGGWLEKIRQENIDELNKIIKKYEDRGLLVDTSNIPYGVKYSDVTAMTSKLTTALKLLLSNGSTTTFSNVSTSKIVIEFKPEMVPALERQYRCAQGGQNVCDTKYQKFLNTTTASEKSFSKRIESALKTFASATQRLREAFDPSNQSADFKAREAQLLNSYNGTQSASSGLNFSMDNGGANPQQALAATKARGKLFSHWRSSAVKSETQNTNIIDQLKPTNTTTQQNTITAQQPFSRRINPRMQALIKQQKVDLDLVQFSEVKDFSLYFNQLGVKIAEIQNSIIGNKDKEGSLIKELGQACELQCGGTAKKCW